MPGARERAPLAPRRRTRAGAADEAHRFLFGAHFGEGVEILRRRGAEDQALGDEQGSVEHGDPLFRLASGDASAARGAQRQAHTLEDTGGKPVSSPSACAGCRGLEPALETGSDIEWHRDFLRIHVRSSRTPPPDRRTAPRPSTLTPADM